MKEPQTHVRLALEAIAAGQPVAVPRTKAIGWLFDLGTLVGCGKTGNAADRAGLLEVASQTEERLLLPASCAGERPA